MTVSIDLYLCFTALHTSSVEQFTDLYFQFTGSPDPTTRNSGLMDGSTFLLYQKTKNFRAKIYNKSCARHKLGKNCMKKLFWILLIFLLQGFVISAQTSSVQDVGGSDYVKISTSKYLNNDTLLLHLEFQNKEIIKINTGTMFIFSSASGDATITSTLLNEVDTSTVSLIDHVTQGILEELHAHTCDLLISKENLVRLLKQSCNKVTFYDASGNNIKIKLKKYRFTDALVSCLDEIFNDNEVVEDEIVAETQKDNETLIRYNINEGTRHKNKALFLTTIGLPVFGGVAAGLYAAIPTSSVLFPVSAIVVGTGAIIIVVDIIVQSVKSNKEMKKASKLILNNKN